VDGVVQEGDAVAEESAENFRDDEAQRGEHGPR
jgi:hypothetical protein